MSTTIVTSDGRTVATRFSGGRERGVVVQLEMSRDEFPAWAAVDVAEEGSEAFEPLRLWLDGQRGTILWDDAPRQNGIARELEAHRWSETYAMRVAAGEARIRAALLMRDAMRIAA